MIFRDYLIFEIKIHEKKFLDTKEFHLTILDLVIIQVFRKKYDFFTFALSKVIILL